MLGIDTHSSGCFRRRNPAQPVLLQERELLPLLHPTRDLSNARKIGREARLLALDCAQQSSHVHNLHLFPKSNSCVRSRK
jgi:hypothetical protein